MREPVDLSVIIPVTDRYDPVANAFHQYKRGIEATGLNFEVIYVLDGPFPEVLEALKELVADYEQLRIITLARWFGETTALNVGFDHARGGTILTLPAYQQVQPNEIPRLISALVDCDMVLARRWPRRDSRFNRFQAMVFNRLLAFDPGLSMRDAGSNVRAFRRRVLDEVQIYGELYTFFPIMAHRQGFRVTELDVTQSERDQARRVYPLGHYLHKLLDILTVFFLVRFTKRPLRFFGVVGSTTAAVGILVTLVMVVQRLFFGVGLAGRPALLLSSLLIVLGIQILAIGLIGEIVIFTHAKELKEYTVEQVIN